MRVVWNAGEIELLGFVVGEPFIDETEVAFRARHGHVLLAVQHLRRITGADDRRQPKLAADDCGVRRAPAVIGDDGGGAPHDRHPIRIGRAGDQNRAVDEAVDIARAFDQADASGGDRFADAEPGHERAAFRLDPVGFQRARLPARLHRFRPRLHDEQLAAFAILRPLHIHGAAIVMFDHAGPACERQDFVVAEHEAARSAFDVGTLRVGRSPAPA